MHKSIYDNRNTYTGTLLQHASKIDIEIFRISSFMFSFFFYICCLKQITRRAHSADSISYTEAGIKL